MTAVDQDKPLLPATTRQQITAAGFVAGVVDAGSFESWDVTPVQPSLGDVYSEALRAAALRSGADEAIITGEALLEGRRIAVIAGEFAFLAGSIGAAAANRIIIALERATAEGLPVLASPASGGTRMQEGTPAFLAMVGISGAVERHKAAGNPYIVYLRHPTTGGAMASWGSLGQLTFAEPGALLGFLGPRVYEAMYGQPFPAGVQTAENLERCGIVDAVVPLVEFRAHLRLALRYAVPRLTGRAEGSVLELRDPRPGAPDAGESDAWAPDAGDPDAWDCVSRSRRADRPGIRQLLDHAATEVLPLAGTRSGNRSGLTVALATFGAMPCVVVAHDRSTHGGASLVGPESLRQAQRGMRLAAELGLPLLTVIDTPGAALNAEAEEGGLAGEIARCLATMVTLPVPTVSVILGQGAGGAAIAFLPADRVVVARHGWLAPLPPEGASAIVHRHAGRAPELARSLGIRAEDLRSQGMVDFIIDEDPDAADEPAEFCLRSGRIIEQMLHGLYLDGSRSGQERVRARMAKYCGLIPS